MRGVPRIPSLPIAWGEAQKILRTLEGPQAPSGAQGGLPLTYHVGPGPAKVRLSVEMDYAVRPIWNVIATLAGRERPEQAVICGNHRDAWTYGAIDPGSGTICLLEMGRAIGELARAGWRPRRSIVLASWDGEEYGLLGSTEWCEANAASLRAGAVAYLNVDAAVSGRDLRAGGSHALTDVFMEVLREVQDPAKRQPLWRTVLDRSWAEGRAEWARRNRERRWRHEPPRTFDLPLAPLGSGSDYTAFVDHLGVPSLDMGFGGLHGTYHSAYDDFEYLDRVVDPGYAFHTAMTDLWQRVALRLAEAEVMPLRYSRTGAWALDELQSLEERADDAGAGKPDSLRFAAPLGGAREGAARMRNAAVLLERRADDLLASADTAGTARLNAALIGAERALLGPGLPGREWFRHELYAPGLNTGYAAVPMPRLGQAVLDGDPRAWERGVTPLREALLRAAEVLERGR
jgi:N-acetylated-alpha-linked acidic dipeptidase